MPFLGRINPPLTDPLEAGVRTRIRGFIEELLETELDAALGRDRYERPRLAETGVGGRPLVGAGHRHGHRERQLMGTFGPATVRVPRARLETSEGKTVEWKNATIPAYQRRTKQADALIATWERQRNATRAQVKWMFTTEKARAKMGRAYPEPASIKAHQTKES